MYNLAIFRNTKGGNSEIKVIGRIHVDEYKIISRDMEVVNHFHLSQERLALVFVAIDDIQKHIVRQDLFSIKRSLTEVVSSFYIFIENIQAQAKRLYGDNSIGVISFIKGFSQEFDSCFAYRFVYKLRNMIIHVDFPNMSVTSKINKQENFQYELSVESEVLLNSFDGWGSIVKNDLKATPTIDLISIFEDIKCCVSRIALKFLNLGDVKEAYHASLRILKYKCKLEQPVDNLIVFRYNDENNPNKHPFKLQDLAFFPFQDAEKMHNLISKS